VSDLEQDWKFPRTAKGFLANQDRNQTSTVLRCVTNTEIPCTAKEAMARGDKLRFSVTVLEVSQVGFAYAPYKRATGNKKIQKDPNARPLFELVRVSKEEHGEFVGGVKMFSFKKTNSNFDRGEFDASKETVIHKGSVSFKTFSLDIMNKFTDSLLFYRSSPSSSTNSCMKPKTKASPSFPTTMRPLSFPSSQ